ncbi:MAG: hypothetical protein VYE68_01875 [Acidobacteriota bacterium]|nr:hypothetical protein [Acidobacteriota bacterium]
MFDPFFLWLEATAFSTWMRESTSVFAFPIILALHTIGLAILVGLTAAFDLRLLGVAARIPLGEFRRYIPLMWLGLWVNVVTGLALLAAYPTKALTNPVFYLKLGLVGAALWLLRVLLDGVRDGATVTLPPTRSKRLAIASLVFWVGAITAGRLLAYTHSRLLASW